MKRSYVIVGSGIGGLISAWRILAGDSTASIAIIERNTYPGGLLAGIVYPNGLYFDIGTHIFQETGLVEVDSFIQGAVPPEELIVFENGTGDIAGSYLNGVLQTNSSFPDLRNNDDFAGLSADLRKHLLGLSNVPTIDPLAKMSDVSYARFGKRITEDVVYGIQENLFKTAANELAGFSMLLSGITRVIGSAKENWIENSDSEVYRSIYGFPEQLELPAKFRHNRRSFYSRVAGSRRFIDGIVADLRERGVQFLFNCNIESFNLNELVFDLRIENQNTKMKADKVIFSNGVIGAAKVCGTDISSVSLDRPLAHTIYNLQLAERTSSPVSYFYGMDKTVDFYRVTNYRTFSGNNSDRRISIEILGTIENDNLLEDLLNQLHRIGFIKSKAIDFSEVEKLPTGFPSPTVKNMNGLVDIANILYKTLPNSVTVTGLGSRPGLFFQNDIIKDVYNRTDILVA
jgi:oxygen-dependent protoporphyrinogen oxidase